MIGTSVPFYNITNTVVDVRLSPGNIIGGTATSKSGLDGYLVFFNKPAAEVVLGTTPPYYFTSVFGLSTTPLTRAGEGVVFGNAISMAFVDDVPLGTGARIANIDLVIQ